MTTRPPTIGCTLGDVAGVGPEVLCEALASGASDGCAVRTYATEAVDARWGDVLADALGRHGSLQRVVLDEPADPRWPPSLPPVAPPGGPDDRSRRQAFVALEALVADAAAGAIDAMLTGPVPKAIFAHLPTPPPGQTEFIAAGLGVERFAMLLAGPRLRVGLVTTHLPLRDVADAIDTQRIVDVASAVAASLRLDFGCAAPRLAVVGLNPHAGESGRLGDEEARLIAPAVRALRAAEIDATGPLAADTVFHRALSGAYDAVVCMYHDQALGPLKAVHFADAVNFTCGLPVPRVSPDHGTAYDIAGQAVADATSMRHALTRVAFAARRVHPTRRT